MFNRALIVTAPIRHHTEYVTRDIHEYRAPTDESVKLLREMEAHAQSKIVEAIHVGDTTFESVIHIMKFMEDRSTIWKAIFSLNGKKMTAEYRYQDSIEKRDAIAELRDVIAKKIATEILIPALAKLSRHA